MIAGRCSTICHHASSIRPSPTSGSSITRSLGSSQPPRIRTNDATNSSLFFVLFFSSARQHSNLCPPHPHQEELSERERARERREREREKLRDTGVKGGWEEREKKPTLTHFHTPPHNRVTPPITCLAPPVASPYSLQHPVLDHLGTACLTGDKDPPGIFQGAWKYPGSWNFPGGLEISRT